MTSLDDASVSPAERHVLERLAELLQQEYGPKLHGVWLFGSRARGEPPHPESDIDILVVLEGRTLDDDLRVRELVWEAAEAFGESPSWFSTKVYPRELVEQRREIRSFFMQEVDRDKIVLAGEP